MILTKKTSLISTCKKLCEERAFLKLGTRSGVQFVNQYSLKTYYCSKHAKMNSQRQSSSLEDMKPKMSEMGTINEEKEGQENNAVEALDSLVASTIESVSGAIEVPSLIINETLKKGGKVITKKMREANVEESLPNIANIKLSKGAKMAVKKAAKMVENGSEATKQTMNSVKHFGKMAGSALGSALKNVLPESGSSVFFIFCFIVEK